MNQSVSRDFENFDTKRLALKVQLGRGIRKLVNLGANNKI